MGSSTVLVRIKHIEVYPNLEPALGQVVQCEKKQLGFGEYIFSVPADEFRNLGCDVGDDELAFPFYATEVELIGGSNDERTHHNSSIDTVEESL